MRAIRLHEFGGPEVLRLEEVARPVPAPDEILVRVYASGVNPADWIIREGGNDFLKPLLKLPLILGSDAAGIVVEVGSQVTSFQPGDAVYGVPNFPGDGSYAEYVAAKASQFACKPARLSFNKAAGVPLAALVAWTGLFEHGNLQPGKRVLVQGAAGGVGTFAVQLAKWHGAHVIGTASASNHELLLQLGADEVLDYRTTRLEDVLHDLDLVFDAAPVRDDAQRLRAVAMLKPGGVLVSTNLDFPFSDNVNQTLAHKQATGALVLTQLRQDWLQLLTRLIDDGKIQVIISQVYPLAQAAEAHRTSAGRHVTGKLVLEVRPEAKPA